ncbi:hypothetical protein [Streptomyces sp. NPDC127098]|uniref:hypothetical protein n=1 Tax=Streptomyces sp. NPDC127098 TaxID=3347137 RepID=UPI00365D2D8C
MCDDFYSDPGAVREGALLGSPVGDDKAVERIRGLMATGEPAPSDVAVSSYVTLLSAESPAEGVVSPPGSRWTALVWLSLPEHCRGGLSFRRAGTGGVVRETAFIEAKFNRAVVFAAGSGPHVDGPGFGEGPETARLTQWLHLTTNSPESGLELEGHHA